MTSGTLDGQTQTLSITFPFLSRDHVHVYIGSAETFLFDWVASTQVSLRTLYPAGTPYTIKRKTPKDSPIVVFQASPAQLRGTDLNTEVLQLLYLAQESDDNAQTMITDALSGDNLSAVSGALSAIVSTETQARIDGDTALAMQITTMSATVNNNYASFLQLQSAYTTTSSAQATQLTQLQSKVDDNTASLTSLQQTTTTQLSAQASDITTLQTNVAGNTATISNNYTTLSDQYSSLSSIVNSLVAINDGTSGATLMSAITNEASARQSGDTAEANARLTLEAKVDTNKADADGKFTTTNSQITNLQNAIADANSSATSQISNALSVYIRNAGNPAQTFIGPNKPEMRGMFKNGDNMLLWSGGRADGSPDNGFTMAQYTTNPWGYANNLGNSSVWMAGDGWTWVPVNKIAMCASYGGGIGNTTNWPVGNIIRFWSQKILDQSVVYASKIMEFSAALAWGGRKCVMSAHIYFFDSSGNIMADYSSTTGGTLPSGVHNSGPGVQFTQQQTYSPPGGGAAPSSYYQRSWIQCPVPYGAYGMQCYCDFQATGDVADAPGWAMVLEPMLCLRDPADDLTQPLPFHNSRSPLIWFNSADSNSPYTWQGGETGWVKTADARIDTALAAISTEQQTRASADNALASTQTTMQTTLNGNSALLTQHSNSINGLSVKFGVTGSINGQTGGFSFGGVLRNDGTVSYNMEFWSNVTINGNLMVNGTVTTNGLAGNAISEYFHQVASSSDVSMTLGLTAGDRLVLISYGAFRYIVQNGTNWVNLLIDWSDVGYPTGLMNSGSKEPSNGFTGSVAHHFSVPTTGNYTFRTNIGNNGGSGDPEAHLAIIRFKR